MLEGPELATSPQGLRLISKLRPPAGHTLGAARCMGWAAAGTASSGVDQTVSGPCGEEGTGRVPSPSRPPLPQWGARAASTVQERQVLNIQKAVSWSLPVWEPGISPDRSVYANRAARPCKAGLFFPFRTPVCRHTTACPRPWVLKLSGVPCTGPQGPGLGWGLCLPPGLSPLSRAGFSWAPLYISPMGFGHVLAMGEGDQVQQ